jgi:hypothetical protein
MGKLYKKTVQILLFAALFLIGLHVNAYVHTFEPIYRTDSIRASASRIGGKITDTRKEKPTFLKTNLKVTIVPFKPSVLKTSASTNTKVTPPDVKLLSNVKVYPNPVSDQLNVNYTLNKEATMTIKIMDFLGNEVSTLLSRKLAAGEQNATFNLGDSLNSGLYFIRFIAGNETIIKRISVQ